MKWRILFLAALLICVTAGFAQSVFHPASEVAAACFSYVQRCRRAYLAEIARVDANGLSVSGPVIAKGNVVGYPYSGVYAFDTGLIGILNALGAGGSARQLAIGGNPIVFNTGTVYGEKVRIDSSGNVGIGTPAPSQKLTVNGSVNITGTLYVGSGTTVIDSTSITSTTYYGSGSALTGIAGVPVGTVLPYAGSSAPSGYLMADGSSHSTGAYPTLFSVIGYTYGGSGGTFYVPNLKGRVAVGRDAGQTEFDVLAETGGEKTHTLTTAEMPSHTHSITVGANLGGSGMPKSSYGDAYNTGSTAATGGSTAHNVLQPYLVINYIIKY